MITYLISRRHELPKKYWNSAPQFEWRHVGKIAATDGFDALRRSYKMYNGRKDVRLRVNGIEVRITK